MRRTTPSKRRNCPHGVDVPRPVFHDLTAPLQQVRARVGTLHLVPDHMRQTPLRNLPRNPCLPAPVPERRAEAVRHATERVGEHGQRLAGERGASARAAASTSSAHDARGTRCCLPVFMRSPGMVQVAVSRSISSHRAPRTSALRQAVSTRNASASWVPGLELDARTFASAAATSLCGNARWCWTRPLCFGSAVAMASPAGLSSR